jgi:hypothetical protein
MGSAHKVHIYLLVHSCLSPRRFYPPPPPSALTQAFPPESKGGPHSIAGERVSQVRRLEKNLALRAGIFKEAMGARNRGGRGLSYRSARARTF